MKPIQSITGNIADVLNRVIFYGTIHISDGKIKSIEKISNERAGEKFILPGFVDSHIHIESSMLLPYEFSRIALVHGTVATVSDPHEIANVMGVDGIRYMIRNAEHSPLKFYFGVPSCVPATSFETAGAEITAEDIEALFIEHDLKYLAEMMNYPGVLQRSSLVMEKIEIAKRLNKVIDGHAPGLRGEDAKNYIAAGISTDHECFTKEEALDKLQHGMKILIREGSAAKNFNALISLVDEFPREIMFCSDDKHPDDLELGHINDLVKRAFRLGLDKMNVLRCACVNPVLHYDLEVGLLQPGDDADFIVVDDLDVLNILQTVIHGEAVAEYGKVFLDEKTFEAINNFSSSPKEVKDFFVKPGSMKKRVMVALDGQLITEELISIPMVENGFAVADIENDILKIAVVNRYTNETPMVGFIKNFGLKEGAIASSVAHDSHNIIVVGVSDDDLCAAVNLVIRHRGGLSAVSKNEKKILPLPVAGLMSTESWKKVSADYSELDKMAKQLGSTLRAPFMTLSFMALLVIPKFKISDKGLFNVDAFGFTELFI
ncbi:MAG: adenine deaminase [Bacteroidetes bacterium]|nr:adenine deaminase [Bacteroidota bacterium]